MQGSCESSLMHRSVEEIVGQFLTKMVLEIPRRQLLMARNEEILFCIYESGSCNGNRCRFHPVSSDCFENVQRERDTVIGVKRSGKAEVYWNEGERNGVRSAVGLVQISSDRSGRTVRHVAFVLYQIQAMLLSTSVKTRWKLI